MPPLRNLPMPIKPMKTERTHEENQERAYIAASRRSDRSLEARIESARRASEIHKRRTGRSLRVREEDVINEEMYEEEDDDLPQQYRRLTAHLATSNTEFDRRLRAYITNQVAMRSVFGQAAAGAFATDQSLATTNRFLTPGLMAMGPPPLSFPSPSTTLPTAFSPSSPTYRQSPYPIPGKASSGHGRSHSVASPTNIAPYPNQRPQSTQTSPVDKPSLYERRMSFPIQTTTPSPAGHEQIQPPNRASPPVSAASLTPNSSTHQTARDPMQQRHDSMPLMSNPLDPISIDLPLESQQLLAGGAFFNYNDPFMSMGNSAMDLKPQHTMHSYNPNSEGKDFAFGNDVKSTDGLDQTLWGYSGGHIDPAMFGDDSMKFDQSNEFSNFDDLLDVDLSKNTHSAFTSEGASPTIVKEEWDSFLHGDAYDEHAAN